MSCCDFSEWYTNGDYLVLLVTVAIILPLSLLRNLGKQRDCVCELYKQKQVVKKGRHAAFDKEVTLIKKKKKNSYSCLCFVCPASSQVTLVIRAACPCSAWCSFSLW